MCLLFHAKFHLYRSNVASMGTRKFQNATDFLPGAIESLQPKPELYLCKIKGFVLKRREKTTGWGREGTRDAASFDLPHITGGTVCLKGHSGAD